MQRLSPELVPPEWATAVMEFGEFITQPHPEFQLTMPKHRSAIVAELLRYLNVGTITADEGHVTLTVEGENGLWRVATHLCVKGYQVRTRPDVVLKWLDTVGNSGIITDMNALRRLRKSIRLYRCRLAKMTFNCAHGEIPTRRKL